VEGASPNPDRIEIVTLVDEHLHRGPRHHFCSADTSHPSDWMAVLAQEQGWGLLHSYDLPRGIAVVLGVVILDLFIIFSM